MSYARRSSTKGTCARRLDRNGLNAGCIEAAAVSGLQAANAVLGRSRNDRIAGTWLM